MRTKPHITAIALAVTILSAAVSLTIQWVYGLPNGGTHTYFADQAWSFLHGRLDLMNMSPGNLDLSTFQGKVYAYWPPLTSFLMLPIVALNGGPEPFPVRLFAISFAALNTGLFFLLFDALGTALQRNVRRRVSAVWAACFGFGTSNLVFAMVAWHWFLGQLTCVTFVIASLWLGLIRSPRGRLIRTLISGLLLFGAIMGRTSIVVMSPLWLFLAISDENFGIAPKSSDRMQRLATTGFWILAAIFATGLYNYLRFDQWTNFGVGTQNMHPMFSEDYLKYGHNNLQYLPRNIYFNLLRLPGMERWDHGDLFRGYSLFFQSPFLLLALRKPLEERYTLFWKVLWICVIFGALPGLTVTAGGWRQFGARYLFDVIPVMAVLCWLRPPPSMQWVIVLGLAAFGVNMAGWRLFFTQPMF